MAFPAIAPTTKPRRDPTPSSLPSPFFLLCSLARLVRDLTRCCVDPLSRPDKIVEFRATRDGGLGAFSPYVLIRSSRTNEYWTRARHRPAPHRAPLPPPSRPNPAFSHARCSATFSTSVDASTRFVEVVAKR